MSNDGMKIKKEYTMINTGAPSLTGEGQALQDAAEKMGTIAYKIGDNNLKVLSAQQRLQIETEKTMAQNAFILTIEDFRKQKNRNIDVINPDQWQNDFNKEFGPGGAAYKQIKNSFTNEQAWKEFEANYSLLFMKGSMAVSEDVHKRRMGNYTLARARAGENYKIDLNLDSDSASILANWKIFEQEYFGNEAKVYLNPESFAKQYDSFYKLTNDKYMLAQVLSYNRDGTINYNNAISKVRMEEFKMTTLDGKEVTVDDKLRRDLNKTLTDAARQSAAARLSGIKEKDADIQFKLDNIIKDIENLDPADENYISNRKALEVEKNALVGGLSSAGRADYAARRKRVAGTATTDPDLFINLLALAKANMDFSEEADEAYRNGKLTMTDYMRLGNEGDKARKLLEGQNKDTYVAYKKLLLRKLGVDDNNASSIASKTGTDTSYGNTHLIFQNMGLSKQVTLQYIRGLQIFSDLVQEGNNRGFKMSDFATRQDVLDSIIKATEETAWTQTTSETFGRDKFFQMALHLSPEDVRFFNANTRLEGESIEEFEERTSLILFMRRNNIPLDEFGLNDSRVKKLMRALDLQLRIPDPPAEVEDDAEVEE